VLFFASIAGYFWLAYHFFVSNAKTNGITVCPIKTITGVPCPSCGTTRSVLSIIDGHFGEAILLNPLGYIVLALMIVIPIGLAYDYLSEKSFFIDAYKKTEQRIRKRTIAIPLILLILFNWLWNIYKFK
jgi:hypothetical protein